MIARIPEEEFAKIKAERDELFAILEILDIERATQSPDVMEEDDHA